MASRHEEYAEEREGLLEYRPLLFVVLIISGCSMCYELIISALSTYLLGNSVLQYSVTIGLYMAAMGLGAYLSKGGKSFICTGSTFVDKAGVEHSKIVPFLPTGSAVSEARPNTHYVVTEYGAVNLKGKSTWERAEALISIANPKFHDELIAAAEAQGIWRKCNK